MPAPDLSRGPHVPLGAPDLLAVASQARTPGDFLARFAATGPHERSMMVRLSPDSCFTPEVLKRVVQDPEARMALALNPHLSLQTAENAIGQALQLLAHVASLGQPDVQAERDRRKEQVASWQPFFYVLASRGYEITPAHLEERWPAKQGSNQSPLPGTLADFLLKVPSSAIGPEELRWLWKMDAQSEERMGLVLSHPNVGEALLVEVVHTLKRHTPLLDLLVHSERARSVPAVRRFLRNADRLESLEALAAYATAAELPTLFDRILALDPARGVERISRLLEQVPGETLSALAPGELSFLLEHESQEVRLRAIAATGRGGLVRTEAQRETSAEEVAGPVRAR